LIDIFSSILSTGINQIFAKPYWLFLFPIVLWYCKR
jgi:hypothetical protein